MPHQISLMNLSRPEERRNFPRSLLATLLRKRLDQLLAVEHSLFESAEHPAAQPGANSKPSPHPPVVGSETAQPHSHPGTLQSRERSSSTHFGPLVMAKIRGRQSEPRFFLSRDPGA